MESRDSFTPTNTLDNTYSYLGEGNNWAIAGSFFNADIGNLTIKLFKNGIAVATHVAQPDYNNKYNTLTGENKNFHDLNIWFCYTAIFCRQADSYWSNITVGLTFARPVDFAFAIINNMHIWGIFFPSYYDSCWISNLEMESLHYVDSNQNPVGCIASIASTTISTFLLYNFFLPPSPVHQGNMLYFHDSAYNNGAPNIITGLSMMQAEVKDDTLFNNVDCFSTSTNALTYIQGAIDSNYTKGSLCNTRRIVLNVLTTNQGANITGATVVTGEYGHRVQLTTE